MVYDIAGQNTRLELDAARVYGARSAVQVREAAAAADVLWNFAGALQGPLLELFPHRLYLDVDPGVVQLSAVEWDMGFGKHQRFLTVGANVGSPACPVPTHGRAWTPFRPFVFLPMWPQQPPSPTDAAFTSVTHWNWCWIDVDGTPVSMSKRDAYLAYADLPARSGARFELAVTGVDDDEARPRMSAGGWRLVDAWSVTDRPETYRNYIQSSRGEICCPKPVHRALRTGCISDRSVCYLASGRPVLMEDTGLASAFSAGTGLLLFADLEEACEATSVIANYAAHCLAARHLAEDVFASRVVLPRMLAAST